CCVGPEHMSLFVLIVEDFDDAREMYEDYLRFSGMTVIGARDGAEGVRLAIEHRPDVIVMDAGLPKLTGWEATAMIRNNEETQSPWGWPCWPPPQPSWPSAPGSRTSRR